MSLALSVRSHAPVAAAPFSWSSDVTSRYVTSALVDGLGAASPMLPSKPEPVRPNVPPPVQAGRSWRFAGPAEPSTTPRRQPQPSPRRLVPLAGPVAEQDELVEIVRTRVASEGDVAAGGCSGVAPAAFALEEYEASAAKPNFSGAGRHKDSWMTELREFRPLVTTPEAAVRGSGAGGDFDSGELSNSRTIATRTEQQVLANALEPSWNGGGPQVPCPKGAPRRQFRRKAARPARRKSSDADMGSTGQFWKAYQAVSGNHQGPAWQDPTPQRAIAARGELDDMHGKMRLKLKRLIKTGQLPAAVQVATGGQSRPLGIVHDVNDEVKKHIDALCAQRRGLTEARKTLEKSVLAHDEDSKEKELGRSLGFMLRGYAKGDEPGSPGRKVAGESGEDDSPCSRKSIFFGT